MLSHSIANLGFISLIVHVLLITTSVEANPPKKEESETTKNVEAKPEKQLKTVTIKAYCTIESTNPPETPVYYYIRKKISDCNALGYVREVKAEKDGIFYAFTFQPPTPLAAQNDANASTADTHQEKKKCEYYVQKEDKKLEGLLSSVHQAKQAHAKSVEEYNQTYNKHHYHDKKKEDEAWKIVLAKGNLIDDAEANLGTYISKQEDFNESAVGKGFRFVTETTKKLLLVKGKTSNSGKKEAGTDGR